MSNCSELEFSAFAKEVDGLLFSDETGLSEEEPKEMPKYVRVFSGALNDPSRRLDLSPTLSKFSFEESLEDDFKSLALSL